MIDYTKMGTKTRDNTQNYDAGLRAYMLKIYNYMSLALLLTGVMAYATLNFAPLTSLMYNVNPQGYITGMSGFGMLISFAPIGIVLYMSMGINSMSASTAQAMFWVYAALMGMSLSTLGLAYTGQSLAKTFFICSATFAGISIYGYTTKKDLTGMGAFLMMGLIGLIIVQVVNTFLQSPAIEFATSCIGLIVFIGLTAYDTQKLKQMYYMSGGGEMAQKLAINGALTLYLDFINLFIYMLRFMGNRR